MSDVRETIRESLFKLSFDKQNDALGTQADIILRALAENGYVVVPGNIDRDSMLALGVVTKLHGKWQKRQDERDTEKVKRIYRDIMSVVSTWEDRKAVFRAASQGE